MDSHVLDNQLSTDSLLTNVPAGEDAGCLDVGVASLARGSGSGDLHFLNSPNEPDSVHGAYACDEGVREGDNRAGVKEQRNDVIMLGVICAVCWRRTQGEMWPNITFSLVRQLHASQTRHRDLRQQDERQRRSSHYLDFDFHISIPYPIQTSRPKTRIYPYTQHKNAGVFQCKALSLNQRLPNPRPRPPLLEPTVGQRH
ncbi:hypothetical protein BDV93DRAFT_79138 [Ceratobasidium sp. AG-I]|nr:hypothetical protein BDV93DRAFT_79138 [Ceratobasidium sp. AG-I]